MIKSKSVFEFRGRHEVLDADGAVIGMLEKNFAKSLLRSHWHVRDAVGQELLEAHEASWIIALLRRSGQRSTRSRTASRAGRTRVFRWPHEPVGHS